MVALKDWGLSWGRRVIDLRHHIAYLDTFLSYTPETETENVGREMIFDTLHLVTPEF